MRGYRITRNLKDGREDVSSPTPPQRRRSPFWHISAEAETTENVRLAGMRNVPRNYSIQYSGSRLNSGIVLGNAGRLPAEEERSRYDPGDSTL